MFISFNALFLQFTQWPIVASRGACFSDYPGGFIWLQEHKSLCPILSLFFSMIALLFQKLLLRNLLRSSERQKEEKEENAMVSILVCPITKVLTIPCTK
jgi:hypothetical protein